MRKRSVRALNSPTIGNCSDCHTTKSGAPYAGGCMDANPYGTIYSVYYADPETGIGKWSEEAFRRAMHEGVDREGRHLYPAFPYDHFTHATDQDLHALYAFLMSQQAVRSTVPSNDLKFPFNIRLLVAGWKILFLSRGSLEPDSSQSPEWNRGRYLVEGSATAARVTRRAICSVPRKRIAPTPAPWWRVGTDRL